MSELAPTEWSPGQTLGIKYRGLIEAWHDKRRQPDHEGKQNLVDAFNKLPAREQAAFLAYVRKSPLPKLDQLLEQLGILPSNVT